MVIRAEDRLSTVIAQDDSLVDVIASLAPAFERLRNVGMRKVMSRLVTVEQVARMAGVDPTDLVQRLNAHVGGEPVDDDGGPTVLSTVADDRPAILSSIPEHDVVHLDVRDELRAGREPFSIIIAALRQVTPDGALAVRAIFEPVPLYAVMARQGLAHWTEQLGKEDWRVWFYPDDAGLSTASTIAEAAVAVSREDSTDDNVVIIDVRGLEPPEPMVRTLAALEHLPAGATLVQINVRVPQFLLPQLEQRGFAYEVREQGPDIVRVFIRHRSHKENQNA